MSAQQQYLQQLAQGGGQGMPQPGTAAPQGGDQGQDINQLLQLLAMLKGGGQGVQQQGQPDVQQLLQMLSQGGK